MNKVEIMADNQWLLYGSVILDWLIFSISLLCIADKLGWKEKWKAWIPGLRIYALGESVKMSREGMICGAMDALFLLSQIFRLMVEGDRTAVLATLIHLVLFIFYFIYRIQIFLQVLRLFGLKKSWLILWLIANWIPFMMIGLGKKYQPDWELIDEDSWKAGTEPALMKDAVQDTVPLCEKGLSIHIRERSVKDFGKKRVLLKDIALNIPPKSLVLLLGGSGAGKTTLINAVIGYEQADATILLNGSDVYKNYESVKHKIGFVPQQNLFRGKDTVANTVRDAARLRLPVNVSGKERRQRMTEVMDLLGLSAGKRGLISKKSGGQLRRICIALELVTDPQLFVLDEPDSGLDGVISREIFGKLRQIADEDRIVMVVTHTPDRVIDLFDKVIVLAKDSGRVGRLAFYGSPQEARKFFEKESMEQIVMSINSREEGGEGRADEMIEKYAAYAAAEEGGREE